MKLVPDSEKLLTNQEVYQVLQDRKAAKAAKGKPALASELKVEEYIRGLSGTATPENLKAFVKALEEKGIKLSKAEFLQVINLRPKFPVEIALIAGHQSALETLDERLSEEQQTELFQLVQQHLS